MTLNKKLKVVFIGCVESSECLLKTLLTRCSGFVQVVGVVTKSTSVLNADYADLFPIASAHNIPVFDYSSTAKSLVDEELASFIRNKQADVCYCFGWSHLLPKGLLNITPNGIVGYHPSKLPENRGRHPIIWPLVLGLNETGSSFFQMDSGADSGPIINQKTVAIHQDDDATSLYKKLLDVAQEQLVIFSQEYANNSVSYSPQDHSKATYWRKRSARDGMIDWRMNGRDIVNLIRGLTKPYIGAEFAFQQKIIKVWRSTLNESCIDRAIVPGTVLSISECDSNQSVHMSIKTAGESSVMIELLLDDITSNDLEITIGTTL